MENIKLFIMSFIVGLGKIIPGVSGSVMAICFGIYEKIVESISSFSSFKKNRKFMLVFASGVILAILMGSRAIKYFLTNYYLLTMMSFIGMMIPGVTSIIKNVKNEDLTFKRVIIAVIVFVTLYIFSIANFSDGIIIEESYFHKFISLILCGILDAASTIIPGISGSAILMIIGYYEAIISSLASLLTLSDFLYSMSILIPFFIGMAIGLVLTSKIITYLFKNYRVMTYMLIIVFAVFSIVALISNLVEFLDSTSDIVIGMIFLVIGWFSTYALERFFSS